MRAHAPPGELEVESVVSALAAVLANSPLVESAFGHGSYFERLPYHDVDVAIGVPAGVEAAPLALSALASRCEAAIGRPVDLHVLSGTSPGFRRSATSGTLIWARDPEAALQYAELLQRMAWDWRPLQDPIIRDLGP